MARAPTTTDVFNAIAEPRRREIVEVLARDGEQAVGDIVCSIRLAQPAVSKHLGVLRDVGVVAVRRQGRKRMYSLNADELRPIHEWTKTFERFWSHKADRIKARAERLNAGGPPSTGPDDAKPL